MHRKVKLILVCVVIGGIVECVSGRNFDKIKNKNEGAEVSPGQEGNAAPASIPQTDNAECSGRNCTCKLGYVGSPTKMGCRPGPQLWETCFKVNPCGLNSECSLDSKGGPLCSCMEGFIGHPPKCEPGPKYKERCGKCGKNTECDNSGQKAICFCLPGFVGDYDSQGHLAKCDPGPQLLKRCKPYTCGPYSDCNIRDGVCYCSCLPGYEGKPPDCRPGPALWRVCFKDRPCGPHSLCTIHNEEPNCMPCSEGYEGKPPLCYKP